MITTSPEKLVQTYQIFPHFPIKTSEPLTNFANKIYFKDNE